MAVKVIRIHIFVRFVKKILKGGRRRKSKNF